MKNFKKLVVWQKGIQLYIGLHIFCNQLPPEEKYALASQIRRAAFSIPANITAGSSKATANHYKLYLENSLGSAYELKTALIAIQSIYPKPAEVDQFLKKVCEIQKMLISFLNKLS